MTDELEQVDTPEQQPDTTPDQLAADTPAEAKNTDTAADEHMIPKSRFDEVNQQLKQLRAEQEKAQREREAAEQQRLEEQNEFKALYEKERQKRETAMAEMKALQLKSMRRSIAADVGLPNGLADRLQGETEDEIKADAEALLKTLPKPAAPNLDGGAGNTKRKTPDAPSWDEIKEQAARLNVNPRHMAVQYGVTPPAKG